ncbi:DNA primase [Mycoplasmatota bacterium WC30]
MARISQKTIDLINDTADIVDVVGEFVPLQAAGKNMKGLCPFHSEKTPSFFVSKERQIFNCFGCGEKGGSVKFIQKYKHLTFVESLKYLADKYNIDIEEDNTNSPVKRNIDLYKANDMAQKFYSLNLLNLETGKPALKYLLDRGLDIKTIEDFGLGYAPNTGNTLFNQLSKDLQPLELLNVGLINRSNDGGYYDLFRSRILFPIRDESNRVIAFSGRIFGETINPAKYVNTPHTELFSKGITLYNLSKAEPHIRTSNRVVLMEGYMDVIKASMAGVKEAICSMGTQLTIDQALKIKKYSDNVIICYDGDRAGREATFKALKLLENAKLNVKIILLPDGQDPDEYITKKGDFKSYIENNQIDQYDFVYQMILENKDLTKPAQIENAKNRLFDFFSKTSGMIREIYFQKFASDTQITYKTLLGDYQQSRIDDKIIQTFKTVATRTIKKDIKMPKFFMAEKTVLSYYLRDPIYREMIDSKASLLHFSNIDIRGLMATAKDLPYYQTQTSAIVLLNSNITEESKKKLQEFLLDEDYEYSQDDIESCIRILQIAYIEEDRKIIKERADKFYEIGNITEYINCQNELTSKQKQIKELEGRNNEQKTNN